jgi:hypothetical protein
MSFSLAGNAMDVLWDIIVLIGHGIEQVFVYVETHHWIFGFLVIGYIFYLHEPFTPDLMRSTSELMKSGNVSPSNIEGLH